MFASALQPSPFLLSDLELPEGSQAGVPVDGSGVILKSTAGVYFAVMGNQSVFTLHRHGNQLTHALAAAPILRDDSGRDAHGRFLHVPTSAESALAYLSPYLKRTRFGPILDLAHPDLREKSWHAILQQLGYEEWPINWLGAEASQGVTAEVQNTYTGYSSSTDEFVSLQSRMVHEKDGCLYLSDAARDWLGKNDLLRGHRSLIPVVGMEQDKLGRAVVVLEDGAIIFDPLTLKVIVCGVDSQKRMAIDAFWRDKAPRIMDANNINEAVVKLIHSYADREKREHLSLMWGDWSRLTRYGTNYLDGIDYKELFDYGLENCPDEFEEAAMAFVFRGHPNNSPWQIEVCESALMALAESDSPLTKKIARACTKKLWDIRTMMHGISGKMALFHMMHRWGEEIFLPPFDELNDYLDANDSPEIQWLRRRIKVDHYDVDFVKTNAIIYFGSVAHRDRFGQRLSKEKLEQAATVLKNEAGSFTIKDQFDAAFLLGASHDDSYHDTVQDAIEYHKNNYVKTDSEEFFEANYHTQLHVALADVGRASDLKALFDHSQVNTVDLMFRQIVSLAA